MSWVPETGKAGLGEFCLMRVVAGRMLEVAVGRKVEAVDQEDRKVPDSADLEKRDLGDVGNPGQAEDHNLVDHHRACRDIAGNQVHLVVHENPGVGLADLQIYDHLGTDHHMAGIRTVVVAGKARVHCVADQEAVAGNVVAVHEV